MRVEVSGVRLPLDAGLPENTHLIKRAASRALSVDVSAIEEVHVLKRSVDARKARVCFIASLLVVFSHDFCEQVKIMLKNAQLAKAKFSNSVALDNASGVAASFDPLDLTNAKPCDLGSAGFDSSDSDSAELQKYIDSPAFLSAFKLEKGVKLKAHVPYEPLEIPNLSHLLKAASNTESAFCRPVVVGTGPAGLFAALHLARAGLRPILLERGCAVDERLHAVERFDAGEVLNPLANIQFGEGGAGTFSDGKLTTGTKSPLVRHVLQYFVDAGAPPEILWQAKPHIGTDKLIAVVKTLREQILEAGGEVFFCAQFSDLKLTEDNKLKAIEITAHTHEAFQALRAKLADEIFESPNNEQKLWINCDKLVLACGHSARDTFKLLQKHKLPLQAKAFSVGVRIEHLQADINRAQYGKFATHKALGPADYKLVAHLSNGRSVYTFCMCPGGEVVAAASEEYGVVVNGMSRYARDGKNANAALLVSVTPSDFASSDPLAGLRFQRRIEQEAFGEAHEMGGEAWQAPAQTLGDFLGQKAGDPSRTIKPSYKRGVVWCDLHEVLPSFVCEAIEEAVPVLDRKLKGFANPDAVMTGVETRSSSPVRIVRDATSLQSLGGIYPCGEGAGYAGGIMSAAVDGLRVASVLALSLVPPKENRS